MATKDISFYFKRDRQTLPTSISHSTIDAMNKEVAKSTSSQSAGGGEDVCRGKYIKITARDRATVGEYAAKNGIAAAIRHFKRNGRFPNLKEATVRGWKNAYRKELYPIH